VAGLSGVDISQQARDHSYRTGADDDALAACAAECFGQLLAGAHHCALTGAVRTCHARLPGGVDQNIRAARFSTSSRLARNRSIRRSQSVLRPKVTTSTLRRFRLCTSG
jgi:hypothetical protein